MNQVKPNPTVTAIDKMVGKFSRPYKLITIVVGLIWFAAWITLFLAIA